jgi:hypothetical protein
MRSYLAIASVFLLAGCAFPQQVRHLGVSYNEAVADLADQLTLTNIERAEQGLPLHYTSFSRLSGGLTFTGGGSINGALHDDTLTRTVTGASTASMTNSTTSTVARALASGGNVYTPNLTASVSTGPTFDIDVLDTQEFYQGILEEIPFTTVNAFLAGGYDDQLLMHLMVHRIDYMEVGPDGQIIDSQPVLSFINEPGRKDETFNDFNELVSCLALTGIAAPPRPLAPLSRVTTAASGKMVQLKIDDLAKIDGKTLDLSTDIKPWKGHTDDTVEVERPAASGDRQAVMTYVPSPQCPVAGVSAQPSQRSLGRTPRSGTGAINSGAVDDSELAKVTDIMRSSKIAMPRLPVWLVSGAQPHIERFITFRSPEGVMKYLGEYLRAYHKDPSSVPTVGNLYILTTALGPPPAGAIAAHVANVTYSISRGAGEVDLSQYRRNLDMLALVEDLVNLQKKSEDRLTTVPVQLVR